MSDKDPNLEPEVEAPAPEASAPRRERRRPAVESEQKEYVAPVPVPPNDDDAKRTREIRRVEVSSAVDPRRRETVRRVIGPMSDVRPPSDPPPAIEETAPLGTNTRAILEANPAARMTVRMSPGALAASPSAVVEAPKAKVVEAPSGGPRGTVRLATRKRGGTRMLVAGASDGARDAESRWAGGPWAQGDETIDREALPSSTRPALTPAHVPQLRTGERRFNAPLVAIVGFGGLLAVGLLIFAVRGVERAPVTDVDVPVPPVSVVAAPNAIDPSPPATAPSDLEAAPTSVASAEPRSHKPKSPAHAASAHGPVPMFEREASP